VSANQGVPDRVVRIVAGLALLSLTVAGPRTMWGLLGALPLLAGLTGLSPAYRLLGVDTSPRARAERG